MTSGLSNESAQQQAGIADYIAIARLDHSTKHIFVVPGIVLAFLLRGIHVQSLYISVALGFVAVACIASANYVINEFLDREFDQFHPEKSRRTAVQKKMSGSIVFLEWFVLIAIGIGAGLAASATMASICAVFAMQGIVYNVKPLRSKDKPFLDVVSESINNPLRLMIGWAMVDPSTLPPSSLILTYWLGGAFLMGAKRLSEFREITASHGHALLQRYRASFSGYSEISLTVSCFLYALLASFFLAVFLIKYRIEYILTLPVVAVMFAHYLALSMQAGSSAQKPEKLYREKGLMLLVLLLAVTFVLATVIDMPFLEPLSAQRFIILN